MTSPTASLDGMPAELRSRALAAAGNATFREVHSAGTGFVVYAISGDSFVRSGLALRQDGSVAEQTHAVPLDGVVFARVDAEAGVLVLDGDNSMLMVPSTVIEAVRDAQGGWVEAPPPAG